MIALQVFADTVKSGTITIWSGTLLDIPDGWVICDGTNVYNANSATVSSLASLTLSAGTGSAPSLNYTGDTTTGFYRPSSGQLGFSLTGTSKMTLEADGLHVVDGIKGGTFP